MVRKNDPLYPIFQKIIYKHKKPHNINNRNKIVGNSLCIGNPGYGKTTSNRREVELRFDLNHKIFCLYDAARMDMCYFMFKSDSPFWKKPKLQGKKIITSRAYPTECFIPVTRKIESKLPNAFIPFTIPVCDLDVEDLVALVGPASKNTIDAAYGYMADKVNDSTTPLDYINILQSAVKRVDTDLDIKLSHHGPKKLIESVFNPLMNQGILSSKKVSTAIDIPKIIKNKKISTLILRHCPKQYHGFLVNYFMNHIFKALSGVETKKIKQNTTIVLNEIADLLSTDEDKGSSAYAISKKIANIAKQSRTGNLFLCMDTQLPGELPDLKETMTRVYVFNSSLPSVTKAMNIIGISDVAGDINSDDYAVIPRMDRGWYYLFDREAGVSVHKLNWLRSRTYLDGEDFYDIYDNIYGKTAYQDIRPLLQELKNEKEFSEETWKTKRQVMGGKKFEISTRKDKPKPVIPNKSPPKITPLTKRIVREDLSIGVPKMEGEFIEKVQEISKKEIEEDSKDKMKESTLVEANDEDNKEFSGEEYSVFKKILEGI